jgi:hypothetical protein
LLHGGRWQPLLWTVILIGLNAYLQFALDKPELMTVLLSEAFGSWIGKNIKPVCHTGFMLTAAGFAYATMRFALATPHLALAAAIFTFAHAGFAR